MAARGNRVGPAIEVLPVDELPEFLPDPRAPVQPARNAKGHYVAGHPATKAAASRAGQARKGSTRLATTLSVASEDPKWRGYLGQAENFRRQQIKQIASTVGAGQCGAAPSALVANAALALAGSRFAYAQGDLALGSRLAGEVRQNLLGAFELASREATAKKTRPRWRPTASPMPADDAELDPDTQAAEFGQPAAGNDAEPSEGEQ
jgi:hypothetical protein